jgi:hypothetical protein
MICESVQAENHASVLDLALGACELRSHEPDAGLNRPAN